MKKNKLLALLLCLLMLLQCMTLTVFAEPEATEDPEDDQNQGPVHELPGGDSFAVEDATVVYGAHSPDGNFPVHGSEKMLEKTKSAILYEVTSDTLVYSWNPDLQMYPSSLAKIMTALLAVEQGDLSTMVTVYWWVLDTVPEDALIAGLYNEEQVTLEQLLYLMMVGSANDAACVIAEHIGGSQENFVAMMNKRAEELGCTGTYFTNAHGIHDEQMVTTARDMVKILRKALEYPEFVEIFSTVSYKLEATNKYGDRYFETTNYMGSTVLTDDYYDSRVTGGRTGNTYQGFRNLAVTAQVDNSVYICIIMEAESEYAANGIMTRQGAFEDASLLLDLAFMESSNVQVVYSGQVVDQLKVINGTNDVVIAPQENASCVIAGKVRDEYITTRMELVSDTLTAPVEPGTYVGMYQVFYGDRCIAHVDLYTLNGSEAAPTAAPTPEDPAEPGFDAGALSTAFMVLGVIFAIILVLGGGLLLIRGLRNVRGKSRSQKRRQNRRRTR